MSRFGNWASLGHKCLPATPTPLSTLLRCRQPRPGDMDNGIVAGAHGRKTARRQGLSPPPFHDPFIPDETGNRAASLQPGRTASIRSTARSAFISRRVGCADRVKAPLGASHRPGSDFVTPCAVSRPFFAPTLPPTKGCPTIPATALDWTTKLEQYPSRRRHQRQLDQTARPDNDLLMG